MAQRYQTRSEDRDTPIKIRRDGHGAWLVEARCADPAQPSLQVIFSGPNGREEAFAFYLECSPQLIEPLPGAIPRHQAQSKHLPSPNAAGRPAPVYAPEERHIAGRGPA